MMVRLWGTRGSLAAPGPETARYGGNTSCVEVRGAKGTILVLDAGTGIRALGAVLATTARCVHLLLTHLHMDHIQGLGFFAPLFDPDVEVHLWGPTTKELGLRAHLSRYLSPPLFPVHLRELPHLVLHDVPVGPFAVGEFTVTGAPVCHPGPTVGYRIECGASVLTYLPDHEPALGVPGFPLAGEWTSGWALAHDADLLIHDAQYSRDEYAAHIGWGHSAIDDAIAFAALARAKHLVTFHHDPSHDDDEVECLTVAAKRAAAPTFPVTPGAEGESFDLRPPAPRA
jgi:phosphoribosyl 1,2-cyclic phosphodiesterase